MLNISDSFGCDYEHPHSLILLLGDNQSLSLRRFVKLLFCHLTCENLGLLLFKLIINYMYQLNSLLFCRNGDASPKVLKEGIIGTFLRLNSPKIEQSDKAEKF